MDTTAEGKHINAYPVSNPARQNTMCDNGDCYWDQCECETHDHWEDSISTYVVDGSGAIVVSAMINGYRKQTAYFCVDEEYAIADFKEAVREDLASTTRA